MYPEKTITAGISTPEQALKAFKRAGLIPNDDGIEICRHQSTGIGADGEAQYLISGFDAVEDEVSMWIDFNRYVDYEWALVTGEGDFIAGIDINGQVKQ